MLTTQNITKELVAGWMKQVFGEGLVYENGLNPHQEGVLSKKGLLFIKTIAAQDAQNKREHVGPLGSWEIHNKSDVYLKSYIPKDVLHDLKDSLREVLKNLIQTRKEQDGHLKLPSVDTLISKGSHLGFNLQALQQLAENGVTPSFSENRQMIQIANSLIKHEKVWVDFKKDVAQTANHLVYGTRKVFDSIAFRFIQPLSPEDGKFILYARLPIYEEHFLRRQFNRLWKSDPADYWNEQTQKKGMQGLFEYNHYRRGAHAYIDEVRIQLTAQSIPDLWLKLKELKKPNSLRATRELMLKTLFCLSAKDIVGNESTILHSGIVTEECKKNNIVPKKHSKDDEAFVKWASLDDPTGQFKKEGGRALYLQTIYSVLLSDGQLGERDLGSAVRFLKEKGPSVASSDQVETLKRNMIKRMPLLKTTFKTAAP